METIKLSTLMGQTQADIIKSINQDIVQPWHDCADNAFVTGSKQAVTAANEYAFEVNGLPYEKTNFPSHITKLWDKTANKAVFTETLDSPVYVARLQMNFLPGTAAEGYMEFKAYINETVPVLFQTIKVAYKATDTRLEALFAFYVGSETGYNIKTKGVIFTYTPKTNGSVYDRGILIYKT